MVTLQISVSEFRILKPRAPVLRTVSKTDRIGRYRYPLNIDLPYFCNEKPGRFRTTDHFNFVLKKTGTLRVQLLKNSEKNG